MTDNNFDGVYFSPAAATDAAGRLDALAQRLQQDLQTSKTALSVPAAGTDEVSVRAAHTMNEVAGSFSTSADAGVLELQKLAASLRAQVTHFGRVENENTTGIEQARSV
ncbi:PE family protein [Nocardia vaccinii]|uniref:PE family protein n=1 Tax=Nocardia vaccinii TaxID=1822 RepID=UPI0008326287|nr:PE family protein [Nocardia vaccinii]